MKKKIDYILNYGLDKQKIKENQVEIRTENVHLLRYMSVIVIMLTVTLVWFPLVVKKSLIEAGYYLFTAVVSFLGYIISGKMKKNPELIKSTVLYKATCISFMHLTLLFGIYVGIVKNKEMIAGLYLIILLWVEMNFIISVIDNLFVGISSGVLFLIVSFIFKERSLFVFDLFNFIVAFSLSQVSSWITGKQRLEKIIAQSELNKANEQLGWNSNHDPLTHLYNRRKFFEESKVYISESGKTNSRLLIGIADIDFLRVIMILLDTMKEIRH